MIECNAEYTGPIPELQGKTAMIRTPPEEELKKWLLRFPCAEQLVLAQFDDTELEFNGQMMGFGWHAFDVSHFTPAGSKPVF